VGGSCPKHQGSGKRGSKRAGHSGGGPRADAGRRGGALGGVRVLLCQLVHLRLRRHKHFLLLLEHSSLLRGGVALRARAGHGEAAQQRGHWGGASEAGGHIGVEEQGFGENCTATWARRQVTQARARPAARQAGCAPTSVELQVLSCV
jgi:hypothetical protein